VGDMAIGENESIGRKDESGTASRTAAAAVLNFDTDDGRRGKLDNPAHRTRISVQ